MHVSPRQQHCSCEVASSRKRASSNVWQLQQPLIPAGLRQHHGNTFAALGRVRHIERREEDRGDAKRMQGVTSSCGLGNARDAGFGQQLRLELIGREDGNAWQHLGPIDVHKLGGGIKFAVVSEHGIADVAAGLRQPIQQANDLPQKGSSADVASQQVIVIENLVCGKPLDQHLQVLPIQFLPTDRRVAGVTAELHGVNNIDFEAQQLQREDRGAVANIAMHHVRLHAKHPRAVVRNGTARLAEHGPHRRRESATLRRS
mmetsp:Transcript_2320/g.9108  ORF Transcript_2320/g.9108 Transcript_2320/m.9108 type:complete len:259 (-) Transcript_2320:8-784(-)